MLETGSNDLSFRVLLRESSRRREAVLEETRERIAGFMAMGLIMAIPMFGIVTSSEFTLVPKTEAAERGTGTFEPPLINFEAVSNRIETVQLGPSEVRELQGLLKNKGFDPGPIDGIAGNRTLSALNAYRQSISLSPVLRVSREAAAILHSR